MRPSAGNFPPISTKPEARRSPERCPMNSLRRLAVLLASILTGVIGLGLSDATAQPDVVSLLKAQTQALLDAVGTGDAKVWDRYLDPDMSYVSEAGEQKTK